LMIFPGRPGGAHSLLCFCFICRLGFPGSFGGTNLRKSFVYTTYVGSFRNIRGEGGVSSP
jgi:hypothetical protein